MTEKELEERELELCRKFYEASRPAHGLEWGDLSRGDMKAVRLSFRRVMLEQVASWMEEMQASNVA